MKWFYFEPKDPLLTNPAFVQIDTKENAKEFLCSERSFDLWDYKEEPLQYITFDYATHHLRGCQSTIKDGVLRVDETQKIGSSIRYQSLEVFEARKDVHIFKKEFTASFLNRIHHKENGPVQFDGCNCRECGKSVAMSEPDGLKPDKKFTCYICKDRLKRLKLFPYKKD